MRNVFRATEAEIIRVKSLVLHTGYDTKEDGRVTECRLSFAGGVIVVGYCVVLDPNPIETSFRALTAYNDALERAAQRLDELLMAKG